MPIDKNTLNFHFYVVTTDCCMAQPEAAFQFWKKSVILKNGIRIAVLGLLLIYCNLKIN